MKTDELINALVLDLEATVEDNQGAESGLDCRRHVPAIGPADHTDQGAACISATSSRAAKSPESD